MEQSSRLKPIYKRVILKITGEAFRNRGQSQPYNMHAVERLAIEIMAAHKLGVQMGIVVGGGNIARGREIKNISEEVADEMGMLATGINALYLQDVLEKKKIEVRTQTAIEIKDFMESFIYRRAIRHLEKGRIVILACGTGHPHCSTDYAATLRALQLQAEAILKGTKVEGVYEKYPPPRTAKPIAEISYKQAINLGIREILDNQALGLLIDAKKEIPLHIFDIFEKGNLVKVLLGEKIGSKIF